MTDKERLEEIRNRMIVEKHYFKYLNSEKGYWENVYTLLEQDMNYLFNTIIEQAERVQELEELVEDYKTVNKELHQRGRKVRKQNKRYREAIERAIDKLTWNSVESEEILLKALEGHE